MELFNICHFPPLLRAPHTITYTSSPFSLISRPSQQQGVFPFCGRVTGNVDTTPGFFRDGGKKKSPPWFQSGCSSVLILLLSSAVQMSSGLQLTVTPRPCWFFSTFLLDGKLRRTVVDPLAPRHENPKVEERCRCFSFSCFFRRNFPPLRMICEGNEGKNRDLYFFRRSQSGTAGAERWQGSTTVAHFSEKCCT